MVSLKIGRYLAWASAVFILLSGIFSVLLLWGVLIGAVPSYTDKQYRKLDPDTIKDIWGYRRGANRWLITIDCFEALAFIIFIYCAMCLRKIHRGVGDSDPALMFYLYVFGAALPALSFLEGLGSITTANTISGWEIPDGAWQSLEIAFLVNSGRNVFLYGAALISWGIAFLLTAKLGLLEKKLPKPYSWFTVVLSFLAFLVFIMEVITYNVPSASGAFGAILLFWAIICLPLWLFWTGLILGQYSSIPKYVTNQDQVELTSSDK